MFTGLVARVGTISRLSPGKLEVRADGFFAGSNLGDSIAVSGVCLSLTHLTPDVGYFDVSPTTASHSRLHSGASRVGMEVNLEKALLAGGRLDGHLVSGHIDGLARVISQGKSGEGFLFEFQAPSELRPLIARKGSVALDGISLTVAEIMSSSFSVAVIPQTMQGTTLKQVRVGDSVHIEVDVLARYVHHMMRSGGYRV